MLSVSTFLLHLYHFTQAEMDEKLNNISYTFLSDNSGLVQRVKQRLSFDVPYPNATLAPDWDIIEQINQAVRTLHCLDLHIQWIKGHQDDTSQELSVAAKYNILADSLADLAFYEIPFIQNSRVVLPAAKCSFFLNNQLIQSHYIQAIRDNFAVPPYKSYISTRHGWTQEQQNTVDWELFQRAISVTSHHVTQVQLTKFLHDKLPTKAELAKSNPHQSKRCRHCNADETFSHVLSCNNTMASKFRSDLQVSVARYMEEKEFPASLQTEFLACLATCVLSEPPIDTIQQPTKCRKDQLHLGTRSLLKGFYTNQWRQFYTKEIAKYTNEPVTNSLDKFAGLIQLIWLAQLKLWESYLHEHFTETHRPSANHSDQHSMYQHKIRNLYSKREQCLPGHRHQYFPDDLDMYLQTATTSQLKHYLHHYEPAILHSIHMANKQPLKTLFNFPGFLRQRLPQIRTNQQFQSTYPTPPTVQPPTTLHHLTGARGAPSHHKHTRWRSLPIPQLKSIRHFFSPKEKPPD